jgi:NAD(P)-dependent dehydrogenase (short-subunit alcohol dehydrogenase family)
MELLRPGVLDGVRLVLAAPVAGPGALGSGAGTRAAALGAAVEPLAVDPEGDEPDGVDAADVLVWDGDAARATAPGVDGVRAALDGAWLAIRPVANRAWIEPGADGGAILLLAPRPADAHAEAARAGLENLARTLSVEWARFCIRPVAVLPGAGTEAGEVAEIVAYLASPAGAYYSGCAFTLA